MEMNIPKFKSVLAMLFASIVLCLLAMSVCAINSPSALAAETQQNAGPTPIVTVNPTSVPAGGTTTVSGQNFTPNGPVKVTTANQPVVNTNATSTGTFTTTITVPLRPGSYTVEANDIDAARSATARYTVVGNQISLSSSTINPGGTITVTGTGFAAGAPVTLTLNGTTVTATADSNGTFTQPITAPLTPGAYTLTVQDQKTGQSTSATVTVNTPALSITTPMPVLPNGTITVTGTNFPANSTVSLSAAGGPVVTVSTDANGTFKNPVTLTAPLLSGPFTITATAPGISPITATGTVATPQLSVAAPGTANLGGTVSVSGSNFPASTAVSLSAAGGPSVSVLTDSSGNLPATAISVPSAVGQFTVTATATGITPATATATVNPPQLTAPPLSITRGVLATITGSGFTPGKSVNIIIGGQTVATVNADGTGHISANVTLPATFATGSQSLIATDVTSNASTAPVSILVV